MAREAARGPGRAVTIVAFAVYLALLAWTVLWKLEPPYVAGGTLRDVKFVPFLPGAGLGATKPLEAAANVALFVPFGLYLKLLAPAWKWWAAAASVLLEAAQYALALGVSDVTDVITNTTGALAGVGIFILARRVLRVRTGRVVTRICIIGTVLAVLAAGLFAASPLHYAPPRHAGWSSTRTGSAPADGLRPHP